MRGGLLAGLVLWMAAMAGDGVRAQEAVYLQIEARPDAAQARAAAQRYAAAMDNVVGYALGTGWYAIAVGPFADRAAAADARRRLRDAGAVPADAFVVAAARTAARFWPEDGGPASEAAAAPEPAAAPPAAAAENPTETPAEARRAEAALDAEARADVQRALAWFGHYDLAVDGAFGPGTRRAMSDWQVARGDSPTGILSSAQRRDLLAGWQEARAAYGFAPWRDDAAGIEITLPLGMVAEESVTPPFVRFAPRTQGGPEVYLISQAGTPATLAALYELIQTLEAVPAEGARSLDTTSFTLTGAQGNRRAHAHAVHRDGRIKGILVLWSADQGMERAITVMRDSLRDLGGTLPDAPGLSAAAVPPAGVGGLELRRPVRSASGFFVDPSGRVLTSAAVTQGCARLTIDQHHSARVDLADADLGIALLVPEVPLAPPGHARFAPEPPQVAAEVVLAGYALPEMTVPVLTLGQIAALEGLSGEAGLRRLTLAAEPGEVGGPVFDRTGAVLGMLLEPRAPEGRILPETVAFAAGAEAIVHLLRGHGLSPDTASGTEILDLSALTRRARAMTVQVACWN